MKSQKGFSLIELAIVLVIVTLLIGGLAVPLSAQIEARRIAETRKIMEEAREAIVGYAMRHTLSSSCTCKYKTDTTLQIIDSDPSNDPDSTCVAPLCPKTGTTTLTLPITRHYLPCPDIDFDGDEDRLSGECSNSRGHFPWVDLGTASQDAWGNRVLYAVAGDLADSTKGFHNNSVLVSNSNQVLSSTAQCSLTPPVVDVATDVPILLVSHGPNGRGARNASIPVSDPTPTAPAATSADELQNLGTPQNTCSPSSFISTNPTDAFDDLVTWLPFGVLISRVCPLPGGCP